MTRHPFFSSLWLVLLAALAACSRPVPPVGAEVRLRQQPWDPALVQTMASLPLQHEGRVKPLGTLAAFSLYFVHGRRDLQFVWRDQDGKDSPKVTLTPTEFVLDWWIYPQQAVDYPLFRIENRQVLDAVELQREGGQKMDFDWLSYRQLAPAREKLREQAGAIVDRERRGQSESRNRSPVERGVMQLWNQLVMVEDLRAIVGPLAWEFPIDGQALQGLFPERTKVQLADLLQAGGQFSELVRQFGDKPQDPAAGKLFEVAQDLKAIADEGYDTIALFGPLGEQQATRRWWGLGGVVRPALAGKAAPEHLAIASALQTALVSGADVSRRDAALRDLHRQAVAVATQRGEHGKVELESDYYRWSLHYQSLHWFLPGFLVVALMWLWPRNRLLWLGGLALSTIGLGYVIADVVLRCVIRDRPPITNLYDTFLFIAATGVGVALAIELINRRRVALSIAPVFGAVVIMLARAFEVEDGQDTMKQLQAVLDSNYWLATHVTTINIGYAAGMVGAMFGTTWLLLASFGKNVLDAVFLKSIVRMTYGITAFGLTFAVVGTILGGVWANDSWGRFWGWDTKENGALLICIAQVALLHARMSGMVKDFGFCIAAALIGPVVAFSWFHVNLLGVGLHAYGFSEGTQAALSWYYTLQSGLILTGVVAWAAIPKADARPAVGGEPVGSAS